VQSGVPKLPSNGDYTAGNASPYAITLGADVGCQISDVRGVKFVFGKYI
jgi:hypothetical protein